MAREKTVRGKTVVASSSRAGGGAVSRKKKRTQAEIDADDYNSYLASFTNRQVKNERHILLDHHWPGDFPAFIALRRQGLGYWFDPNPGFNKALVVEFYRNMRLVYINDITEQGARIESRIGDNVVFMTVEKIAGALNYRRPEGVCNFPRAVEDPVPPNAVAHTLYEHSRHYKLPHVTGKFDRSDRVLNQIVCFNIAPRGSETHPGKRTGEILWALGQDGTVCDWALLMFCEMAAIRTASTHIKLPFPCTLTKIFHEEQIVGGQYYVRGNLDPGPIDSSYLVRSEAQVRAAANPLQRMPSKGATSKVW